MKIHAYLLCFNESRIIKHVLDYYSEFCEKIFVLDNFSTDNSASVAMGYEKVDVIKWSSKNKFDDRYNVFLKETLPKQFSEGVDWVITADMDELIYHPNLVGLLESFKKRGVTVPKVQGFNMVSLDEPDEEKPLIQSIRTGYRYDVFDKPIIFSPDFNMKFSAGCHPKGPGYKAMISNASYSTSERPVYLLHYKYIGTRHFDTAKVSALRLSDDNIKKGWGQHYLKGDEELSNKTKQLVCKSSEIISVDGKFIWSENG